MIPSTAARVLATAGGGVLGLVIGSFLNVVIYRVPRHLRIDRPASRCPTCGHTLAARDNVPLVSWVVLGGKCRTCRTPISPRYPLVELGTALAFLGMGWSVHSYRILPSLLVLVAATVAATGIDVDGLAVPWPVAGPALLGAVSLVAVAAVDGQPGRVGWAAAGGVACLATGLVTDRSPRGLPRAAVAGALGWAVGWLWPPAGGVLAAWILASGVALAVWTRRRPGGAEAEPDPMHEGEGAAAAGWSCRLLAAAIVGYGLLVAGALSATRV
jgi:leader peptidase (prepilin peptidase)/N-methyltransferase